VFLFCLLYFLSESSQNINIFPYVKAEKVQDKAKAKKQKEPAADISKYLGGAGLMETRYVRMVSSLCAQTYYMHKLTVCSLVF
jgi:hypothetical protein